ncbi:hydroxyacylglutathione hydrolase [Mangrovibrevibacter kandeliae]|uniref:hydroxyacylglutathione hydrolase n=1 Tax=Mangrovibrevibacter kandeliae TaxID=2968473 RepID=UPI002118FBA3|nr:hydroxyacylglutathione hydrolase [Aurantimonas sp. CSK15Z-1]MCQ8783859.1 hydroxyacylglutathione hydrolase [Aurantimonas sp. CSK15Z-1]
MSSIEIHQFTCRKDNFGVLVHDREHGTTLSIDAPEEAPILSALQEKGWGLDYILTTHHHGDHVEANEALKARFGAEIIGPGREQDRIPGLDRPVVGDEHLILGEVLVETIDTPGHTIGEISYHMPLAQAVFTADALFSLGCGRLFEGTPQMLWDSLKRLRELPDETMLYCGHEYTATNARCALTIDPDNLLLRERATEVEHLRAAGKPTLPVRLGQEKKTNPFLRADDPDIAKAMGMEGADPVEVFAAMRKRRDSF